jgi:tRNA (guanine-N7-)-methyltransferase
MGKKKLQFFAELEALENVVELSDSAEVRNLIKGHWNERFFKNDHPICLELACGKGEYTNALAEKYPETNFVGIDIKGARINRGAKQALEKGLTNVMFLRIQIEHIAAYFAPEEVSEMWITFPDPHLRNRDAGKRLTSPRFLKLYAEIVKKDAVIHLKTDNQNLYDFTLIQIEENSHQLLYHSNDVYSDIKEESDLTSVQTTYEKMFLDDLVPIKYVKFQL